MRFGSSNNAEAVKARYATSEGLNTRLSFHDRFSTNKQGYAEWIVSHYDIHDGMKMLELGCGTGKMWLGHTDIQRADAH